MAILYYITVEGDDLQILKKDNGVTTFKASYQGNQVSMQTDGAEESFSLVVNGEIIATIQEAELAAPASITELITLLQTDAYAGPGVTVEGASTYTKVHRLIFPEDDFTVTQPQANRAQIVPKGYVKAFKANYNFLIDGWTNAGQNDMSDYDIIPEGTWQMVGAIIAKINLGYGVLNEMILSIADVESQTPIDGLINDVISGGGPSFFIDGGRSLQWAISPPAWDYINSNPTYYDAANPATALYQPFGSVTGVNSQAFVVPAGGAYFYLADGTTTVTSGQIKMQILLKRVA